MALRAVQYLDFTPLWHDEAALARNLDERTLPELLTKPLSYSQVAPAGWLVILELASHIPMRVEGALRFPSFVISLAGFFVFAAVARRFLTGATLVGAVFLYAITPPLLWYSATPKQYGVDIAGSICLVWLALRFRERRDLRTAALAAAVGGVIVLLSFPCIVIAAALGVILLVDHLRSGGRWQPLVVLGAGWGVGALVATVAAQSVRDPRTDSFMDEFWAEGFLPWGSASEALVWAPLRIWDVFAHFLIYFSPRTPLEYAVVALPMAFALAGLFLLWRRRSVEGLLLLTPVAVGIILGAAHLLPLLHRAGVYIAWPILMLAFVGVEALRTRYRTRWLRVVPFVPALPLVVLMVFISPPPYRGQATRPVLESMQAQMQPGDQLYVTCGGRHAMAFYAPRLGLRRWDQGSCNYDDHRALLPELNRYAGTPRLWMYYTQSHGEAELMREHLAARGRVVAEIKDTYGGRGEGAAGAVLFDLRPQ